MREFLSTIILCTYLIISSYAQDISAYNGFDQVSRYDSTCVYMEESGLSYVKNHKRIVMLNFNGCKNNNVLKMDYDPQSAYVEIRELIIHRNSGKIDTILYTDKKGRQIGKKIYDYTAPARLIYWGAKQKMVEIGHLEPYDEIEFKTLRKGFTYALLCDKNDDSRYIPPMRGHFYDIVPFWSKQPIIRKVYKVNVLKSKNLQYHVYNGQLEESQENLDSGRIIYCFSKENIVPSKKEPRMLANNDVECKLLLSTSPNWEAKSIWFYGVNENYGSFTPTVEVISKVKEILNGAKNELDSISRLTHWVADNIRYCGISMGEGEGYTLHNAEMNFTDRCGVCKDKAGMLISMLRAAGFKSYAAMTMAGERIDRIPADQFNHSVCVVQKRNGEYQLLDPTWVPNVRELWSSAEQQQAYLMGLPEGADLMYTPVSPSENHYIKITCNDTIDKKGNLSGIISIQAEGQSDNAVRRIFNCRTSEWQGNLEKELLKIDPRAIINEIKHTDNDKYIEQAVRIEYNYTIPKYAIVDHNNLIFIPFSAKNIFSAAMGELYFNTSLEERNYPFSDRCSRLVEINETTSLPQEYSQIKYNQPIENVKHSAVNFSSKFDLDENIFKFYECANFNKRIYDAADWGAFRKTVKYRKILAVTPVILTK